jgi:hypothetical protein
MSDLVERLRKHPEFFRPMNQHSWYASSNPDPDCQEAATELERLRAEVEALRKDAERYRWLRSRMAYRVICDFPRDKNGRTPTLPEGEDKYPAGLDAAIDAATSPPP